MRKTLSLLAALLAVACGGDEQTDTSALQPTITQQEANARYRVKAGRELLIAPSYTNAEGARFTWTCDDEVVCREASYVFRRDKAGIYYLSLRVENDYGAAEDELRVRVDALEAPCITLIEPVGGFTVAADAELTIRRRERPDGALPMDDRRRNGRRSGGVPFPAARMRRLRSDVQRRERRRRGLGLVHCKSIVSGADALLVGISPDGL